MKHLLILGITFGISIFLKSQAYAICGTCDSFSGTRVSCSVAQTNLCCTTAEECPDPYGPTPQPYNPQPNNPPPVGAASASFAEILAAMNLNPNLHSIDGVINALLIPLLTISGLILFIMLITGGFEFLFAGGDPKSAEKGQQRITTAIIGFLIIFTAYWVTQIVEIVLGIKILGN
jgi:hypothetical protein